MNYKDFLHLWNPKTNTYDLIHKQTGEVLKQNQTIPANVAQTIYDPLTADLILQKIVEGKTLTSICKEAGFPSLTVLGLWMRNNKTFRDNVHFARTLAGERYHDKIVDLAEGAENLHKDFVAGTKLAIDTYKWLAEKASPERFAKTKEEDNNGKAGVTIILQTGVLETPPPADIIVDPYGNFMGFGETTDETDRSSNQWSDPSCSGDIELSTDRFREIERDEQGEE